MIQLWNRYIEYFNGYRMPMVLLTLNIQDAIHRSETGKEETCIQMELTKNLQMKFINQHLEGKLSIGIQPCTENSEVKFGVIDIDPKDYADFNKKDYIDIIQQYELPLLPVESKSGGLHLFLFMDTFTDSKTVKSFLTNLLSLFGLKQDTEIFPKQTQLTKDSETGQLRPGQFINLPYFGEERKSFKQTVRRLHWISL